MMKTQDKTAVATVKDVLLTNPDGLREVIRAVMQAVLEAGHRQLPRLVRALAVDSRELDGGQRIHHMDQQREHKRLALRNPA
ncbi:hypothetical protein [Sinorhizobium fredii]|uniref:Uncharacterized protein n=1 Tax=Rhizobium fredii TaxID=380 RepID=A0A844A3H3_RHIFR|nr:hypothetical protein [Sinorhizobium fredii]ASY73248.1 Mobile element protein [Sinorhizobium fredii CCBAU 83666]MQX07503.1 hypothetical protein [Sinorhizobium fredii]GEC35470.1 hypothetical protein EFR01_56410 [Sinorhizobium fredii]GLS11643.1 hypothetical protein GCM10007864_52750 [Sinorhizobium fredii]